VPLSPMVLRETDLISETNAGSVPYRKCRLTVAANEEYSRECSPLQVLLVRDGDATNLDRQANFGEFIQ
jgi:hypothetical protein